MASNFIVLSLLSGIVSLGALIIVYFIFRKVYQEEYRKPWLYIGGSLFFLALSRFLLFSEVYFGYYIINAAINEGIVFMLEFIAIMVLAYGVLLELLIMVYYKGKFVKMEIIPVQEGTLGGELNLNISEGNSYIATDKDKKFLMKQFSDATQKGFEGFLITQDSPKDVRKIYKIEKSPILWVTQIGDYSKDSNYIQEFLSRNSGVIDSLELNNAISYVNQFIEQSRKPLIFMEVDLIAQNNNYPIFLELIRYIKSVTENNDGILVVYLENQKLFTETQLAEIKTYLNELD